LLAPNSPLLIGNDPYAQWQGEGEAVGKDEGRHDQPVATPAAGCSHFSWQIQRLFGNCLSASCCQKRAASIGAAAITRPGRGTNGTRQLGGGARGRVPITPMLD